MGIIDTIMEPGDEDVTTAETERKSSKVDSISRNPANLLDRATRVRLSDIVKRAREGDRSVLPELREALDEYPACFAHDGDLFYLALQTWLTFVAEGNLLRFEAVERHLAGLKSELVGSDSTPLEKLLVERILICWLQVHYADIAFVTNYSQSEWVRKELTKRQESAQRRYFDGIKQLAELRKMLQVTKKSAKSDHAEPTTSEPAQVDYPIMGAFCRAIKADSSGKLLSTKEPTSWGSRDRVPAGIGSDRFLAWAS
jgi:hypothetical protein